MEVFVARQPVFNTQKEVFGYELLFRNGFENAFPDVDGTCATSGVLANTFFSFNLDDILNGKPGLINFTRDLLLKQTPLLFPKEHIIIEVLEDIEPEPNVTQALYALKKRGFRIALDDFIYDSKYDEMMGFCDMIKFDLLQTPLDTLVPLLPSIIKANPHITLLAEKVESHEEFKQAKAMGFSLFQGYFFSRPEILSKKDISTNQATNLKLLSMVSQAEPDISAIKNLIKNDISISFKLLKFINSPYFQRLSPINTIKDAITFLGLNELKKFIHVVAVSDLNPDKPRELIRSSIVRAGMCEKCGKYLKTGLSEEELFTIGLFSSMDAIMDMPMESILDGITLSDKIKDALLKTNHRFQILYYLIRLFERGRWNQSCFQADDDGALVKKLPVFYKESVKMADAFFNIAA